MADEGGERTALRNTLPRSSRFRGTLAALLALALATPALAAPGDLDPTFGTGGIVKTAIGTANDADARTLLQQPDGKLVAAGNIYNGSTILSARRQRQRHPRARQSGEGGEATQLRQNGEDHMARRQ